MNYTQSPSNLIALEEWMKDNCFNFNGYSINGNFIFEGFGIEKSGALLIWYYTERGKKEVLKYFDTEAEIVAYAFEQIKSDRWAKTHNIGFSTDLHQIAELKKQLQQMDIEFLEDQIPYYYRVFVLGCDIHRTAHLKEIYHQGK